MAQLMGRYMDESGALKAALHANCAAAALSLEAWHDALAQAQAALALAPRHAKALFRKGKAHAALGQDDAARDAFTKAADIDPQDAGIRAALRALDACVPACVTVACLACADHASIAPHAARRRPRRARRGAHSAASSAPRRSRRRQRRRQQMSRQRLRQRRRRHRLPQPAARCSG